MAIMTSACNMFDGIPPDLINMETFWHYSIICGVTARAFAKSCHVLHPERLFDTYDDLLPLHRDGSLLNFSCKTQNLKEEKVS